MIMELAYRTELPNPNINGSDDVEEVVAIDKIDMHLHLEWQWQIIDALQGTFPKVQFILATHSPVVISSAENARLILVINPNKFEELQDAYGLNVDNILELRQQSVDMPPELKKWRKRIMSYLNHSDLRNVEDHTRIRD